MTNKIRTKCIELLCTDFRYHLVFRKEKTEGIKGYIKIRNNRFRNKFRCDFACHCFSFGFIYGSYLWNYENFNTYEADRMFVITLQNDKVTEIIIKNNK